MSAPNEQKKFYIVLSQTGSIVAKAIKIVTHKEFSHASISLSEDLETMYSFGRKYAYFPLPTGFVRESPKFGTLKRFSNSNIAILEISVTPEMFETVKNHISEMVSNREQYHYNIIGLFKAGIKMPHPKREYYYYCSEFVRDLLIECNISGADKLPKVIHPVHFMDIPHKEIYRGRLSDYAG